MDRLPRPGSPSNIPIPDPSVVTAREIEKVTYDLRERITASTLALKELIESRLVVVGNNTKLLTEQQDKVPDLISRESARIESLVAERFAALGVVMHERSLRSEAMHRTMTAAADAALQAQKDASGLQHNANVAAISKSEASFTKEIDGLKALIGATRDAMQSELGNLTGRLDRDEGSTMGTRQRMADTHATIGSALGVVGGVVGVLALLAMLMFNLMSVSHGSSADSASLRQQLLLQQQLQDTQAPHSH